MATLKQLELEIDNIKQRNHKVEGDKAWEQSHARKVLISVLTFIFVYAFFMIGNVEGALLNSILATIGFLLSTLTIPFFKKLWIRRFYK